MVLNNRVKTFRIVVHIGSLLPLVWTAYRLLTNQLGANPVREVTRATGTAALIELLLTLACTPLRLLGVKPALAVRKALGLYAFLYAALHFLAYAAWDYALNIRLILQTLPQQKYILIGLAALLILLALAVTSNQKAIERLGGKRWKLLHRMIYLAAGLVILHAALAIKTDPRKTILYTSVLVILMTFRLPFVKSWLKKRTAS